MAANDLVEALAGQLTAAEVHEQMELGAVLDHRGPAALEVDRDGARRGLANRHDPLLRALAARPQHPLLEVHVLELEPDRLGGTQPAGVHQLEQCAVAQRMGVCPERLREQALDLSAGQHVRQLAAAAGRADGGRGVGVTQALAAQVAVERAQAGRLAMDRGGRRGPLVAVADRQAGEEVADVAGARIDRRHIALGEKAPELQQVGAVCLECVAREAALELEVGEEVEHEVLEAHPDRR